jgi:hypothetical protein
MEEEDTSIFRDISNFFVKNEIWEKQVQDNWMIGEN